MPSKISVHVSGYVERTFDILERMQPSVIKVYNQSSEMNIDEIRRRCPGSILIYRQYTDLDLHSSADAYFAEISNVFGKLRGRGIYWEGLNEPVPQSVEDAQKLNRWFVRFAEIMHAHGELVAGFSWSTGNPTPDKWDIILPNVIQAAAACDLHAFHEYYSTWGHDGDWGRYRAFEAALPAFARKPVVITEAGLDDTGDNYTGGYRGKITFQQYIEILRAYDALLMQDPYCLGATVFAWADWSWPSFELDPMINLVADYIASVGGGAYIPRPFPKPDFEPQPTYTFTVTPTSILVGQSATLQWNAEGVREIYLDGVGVAGAGSRIVNPTETTTYTLRIVLRDESTLDLTATLTVNPAPVPSFSFTATPATIFAGQSATLQWDVEGVREVYLDGQAVTGHETRVITPSATKTYTLRIVMLDGSTHDLTATITVTPAPTVSFTATPSTIQAGASATLQWNVTNARTVQLDGQAVAANASLMVTPAQTTTYTLSIVFLDGTTRDLSATVIVAGAPPPAGMEWDPTLDLLRVKLVASSAHQAWRVVAGKFLDETQSQGKHHVLFTALNENHAPVPGINFVIDWMGRDPSDSPAVVTTGANGKADCPLWVDYDPQTQTGLYLVYVSGAASDRVEGLGLAGGKRVNFDFIFQWNTGGVTPPPPAPTATLTATPSVVGFGQSTTLQWSTTGARAVSLDHESVPANGTKSVAPTQTTAYTLRVNFLDGTTRDVTTIVTVTGSPPPAGLHWDPRLTTLGVNVVSHPAASAWRLIEGKYQDETEAGGTHHIYYKLLNANGTPAAGVKIVVDWVGRESDDQPAVVMTDSNGEANCPLWAVLQPELKDGAYFTYLADQSSDTVRGMGLPAARHVNFLLTFRFQ